MSNQCGPEETRKEYNVGDEVFFATTLSVGVAIRRGTISSIHEGKCSIYEDGTLALYTRIPLTNCLKS
jgi:hypothetical protein